MCAIRKETSYFNLHMETNCCRNFGEAEFSLVPNVSTIIFFAAFSQLTPTLMVMSINCSGCIPVKSLLHLGLPVNICYQLLAKSCVDHCPVHRGLRVKTGVLSLTVTELVIQLVQGLIRALSDSSNFDQDYDSTISILNSSSLTFIILRSAWRTSGVLGYIWDTYQEGRCRQITSG